jgi:secreted trypsin-like serine protease
MMTRFSLLFVGLALIACGANGGGATGQNGADIIGGTPTSDKPAVVALYAHVPDAGTGALCTAEVVSPTVVLSAAHCVHPDEVGATAKFYVFTGTDLNSPATRGDQLQVSEVHWDSLWSKDNLGGGHDFSVIILSQPTTIAPMAINRAPLDSSLQGSPVSIIGYGLDDGIGQKGAGVKRIATVSLDGWSDQFVQTGNSNAGICSGDSGGPVIAKMNGVDTIIGVNSFGFLFCLGQSNSTRPDTNLDFISQYVP